MAMGEVILGYLYPRVVCILPPGWFLQPAMPISYAGSYQLFGGDVALRLFGYVVGIGRSVCRLGAGVVPVRIRLVATIPVTIASSLYIGIFVLIHLLIRPGTRTAP